LTPRAESFARVLAQPRVQLLSIFAVCHWLYQPTLALSCYEQAAMLPALLLAHDLISVATGRRTIRLRPWVAHQLALWTVLGFYLLWRRLALGDSVSGYGNWVERLSAGSLWRLANDTLSGMPDLFYPAFSTSLDAGLAAAASGLVLALMTAWALRAPRRDLFAFWWLLGVVLILLTQAPFSFETLVPATGRYCYLTSIGIGFVLLALAEPDEDVVSGTDLLVVGGGSGGRYRRNDLSTADHPMNPDRHTRTR
jgi:hypothetical protein